MAACIAAVAAKADDARRERLARAVREKDKDKVEGGEDDALCVICLGPPVDPVEVRFFAQRPKCCIIDQKLSFENVHDSDISIFLF